MVAWITMTAVLIAIGAWALYEEKAAKSAGESKRDD